MKSISKNSFSISLPTKGAFDLRIRSPAQAMSLTTSLVNLLSLVLETHDTQWLLHKFNQLDSRTKKFAWCRSVKDAKSSLLSARLDAARVLLIQTSSCSTQENAMKLLLKWLGSCIADGELNSIQSAVERALDSILSIIRTTPSMHSIVVSSNLSTALRGASESPRDLSPSLQNTISQIIQLANPAANHPAILIDHPHKRRNIENTTTIDSVFKHLLTTVRVPRDTSQDHVSQLKSIMNDKWATSAEIQRCSIAEYIGLLGCAAAGKLKSHIDDDSHLTTFKCSICDGTETAIISKQPPALDLHDPIWFIFQQKPSPSISVAAVRAFGRLVTHNPSLNVIDLSKSALAQIVLGLVSSENREQRIAVAQLIPLLFKDRDSPDLASVLAGNRQIIFRQLRTFQSSPSREKALLETTVMAYAEIGKVAGQSELSSILSYLVDFLGHNNSFIAALAYREILAIATHHTQSTWQMFSPFWPSISVKIVEQMRSRPQILQRLSEILDIRDSVFLNRTQSFTVPILVLKQYRDVLEQMSQKMGVPVWEMLKENMAFVLAALFTQEFSRTKPGIDFLIDLMSANKANEKTKPTIDTRSLIFSCRTPLTAELLKMLASESDVKRERVFHALQTVALYVSEKPVQDLHGPKVQEFLKSYLQNNMLELMNYFTDIITDKRGRKTFTEKIGCIAGIQEIIRFAAGASKAALPQVVSQIFKADLLDYRVFSDCAGRRLAEMVGDTSLGDACGKRRSRSREYGCPHVCRVHSNLATIFATGERYDQVYCSRRNHSSRSHRSDRLFDPVLGQHSRTRNNRVKTRLLARSGASTIYPGETDAAMFS